MEIKIHRKNCDRLVDLHKARWTLFIRNNLISYGIYGLTGTTLLIICLCVPGFKEDPWGFNASFAMALILLSLLYSYNTFRNKLSFLNKVRSYINRFNQQAEGTHIVINDDFVSCRDFESYYEIKWDALLHYKLHKDFLFLLTIDGYYTAIGIHKSEVSAEEFNELLKFVTSRLTEKK